MNLKRKLSSALAVSILMVSSVKVGAIDQDLFIECMNGDQDALYYVANCYKYGIDGVEVDEERSRIFSRQLSETYRPNAEIQEKIQQLLQSKKDSKSIAETKANAQLKDSKVHTNPIEKRQRAEDEDLSELNDPKLERTSEGDADGDLFTPVADYKSTGATRKKVKLKSLKRCGRPELIRPRVEDEDLPWLRELTREDHLRSFDDDCENSCKWSSFVPFTSDAGGVYTSGSTGTIRSFNEPSPAELDTFDRCRSICGLPKFEDYEFGLGSSLHGMCSSESDVDQAIGDTCADGVTGIKNYGNSCYLNSLIQQLYRNESFKKFIEDSEITKEQEEMINVYSDISAEDMDAFKQLFPEVKKLKLKHDLKQIFSSLDRKSSVSKENINAIRLNIFKDDFNQQDAHECMVRIFEMLDFNESNVTIQPEIICTHDHVRKVSKSQESLMLNITDEDVISVVDALVNFFDPEDIEVNCDEIGCGSKVGTKVQRICKPLPDTLMITLNRFNADRTKNDKEIHLNVEVDLKKFCDETVVGSTKYQLKGIIVQKGILSGGHYISYVFENGKWYCINDDRVSVGIKPDGDIRQNAYILRYEKVSE